MELLFESRENFRGRRGKLYAFQHGPTLHPDPVLIGEEPWEAAGVSRPTVLRDGGVWRMWYAARPRPWDGTDGVRMAHAESDDGIVWRKPAVNGDPGVPGPNNLCNAALFSVFIDPDSPPGRRYRGVGYCVPGTLGAPAGIAVAGYYTFHSGDGLHWAPDAREPTWPGSDVITAAYHPGRRVGIAALKRYLWVGGMARRSFWTAELRDGAWGEPVCALVPDDYADASAQSRGYATGDYYGLGFMPAGGQAMVGFLWQFRHSLPHARTEWHEGTGLYGNVDVSLVYQAGPGDVWLHQRGRPDFVAHGEQPWAAGSVYSASCAVNAGGEQRLYLNGQRHSHGYSISPGWKIIPELSDELAADGLGRIGFAHWPKWRLFGFHADPEGALQIDLGRIDEPKELVLNYEALSGGCVRVGVSGQDGRSREEAVPMTGNSLEETVAWNAGTIISPCADRPVIVVIYVERAKVYAYELRDPV